MGAILISSLAVLVSLGSLPVSYTSSRRSQMPVLQFMWDVGSDDESSKWWLANVGSGPATNIVVAQTEKTSLRRGLSGEVWYNPVVVPSIPSGGKLALTWLGEIMGLESGLGASYTDAQRFFYTTKCGDDVSIFFVGLHIPRWPMLNWKGVKWVKTWWGVEDLSGPKWSAVTDQHVCRRWWLAPRFGLSRRLRGWADPVHSFRGE